MKHAGAQTLAQLEPLLVKLRAVADAKLHGSSFERLPLRTPQDHALLVEAVAAAVESRLKRATPPEAYE